MKSKHKNNNGFTIVELMIALTVLSTLLVTATAIMIRIGYLYTKGVNSANLQNTNRNVANDVLSALQFSGYDPFVCRAPGSAADFTDPNNDQNRTCAAGYLDVTAYGGMRIYSFCINTTRYSYVFNRKMGDTDTGGTAVPHVLWRDTMKDPNSCQPLDLSQPTPSDGASVSSSDDPDGVGTDLVPRNMRLTRFRVIQEPSSSGVFTVNVSMAYGDSDLLCDSGTSGNCNSSGTVLPRNPSGNILCKGDIGSQFCAISRLDTTVTRRIVE